ncbi:MAG: UDP-N-acetylglucosamine 1-carboxyvinyltransferase [Clostridiales bacterium]|nr:UDP-N-acetylglucosamine 1-carboxyvinyltransferase [Clostridiales bacterium]
MNEIRIVGGRPLSGTVAIQGSKNAALPMMAAALLSRGISVLRGCPKITDVFYMEEILWELGARTWWERHDLYLDCRKAEKTRISAAFSVRMRSSALLLGPLLARNGGARIGYPGGCVIGKRPVDLHLYALRALGARFVEAEEEICAVCPLKNGERRLQSGEIRFEKNSVGATEQAILAAAAAKGNSVIYGCAREPEIVWLCRWLRNMGARIRGEGTRCIFIQGVDFLKPGDMQVPPDRIVAGNYLCAAAVTRSRICLENVPVHELDAFLSVYRKIGGQYTWKSGKLIADARAVGRPVPFLRTEAYPGFPTDLQSPMMAVLATIPGESRIREEIFEDRYKAAAQLSRMGARIRIRGKDAWIRGGYPLQGCEVAAEDLRGGAALVLAALGAQGITGISGCSHIHRGYEHICGDLNALGGMLTTKRNQRTLY